MFIANAALRPQLWVREAVSPSDLEDNVGVCAANRTQGKNFPLMRKTPRQAQLVCSPTGVRGGGSARTVGSLHPNHVKKEAAEVNERILTRHLMEDFYEQNT